MSVLEGIVLALLVFLSFTDIKKREIPVIPVLAAGGVLAIYRFWTGTGIVTMAVGLIPGLLLLLLTFCTKGGIGAGDGLVLCVLGTAYGVERTVAVLGLAFVLAALTAMLLLALGKAGRKTELPFLPCLLVGYLAGVFR